MKESSNNNNENNNNSEETISHGRFVKKSMTTESLLKKYKVFKINFDLAIQRKENIWDGKRQSLLIHSILTDLYIPPIVAVKNDSKLNVLDGKQRLLSTFEYIGKEFALDKTTPAVNGVTIAGLLFDELPMDMQKAILKFKYDLSIGENLSDAEIEDLFYKLNNGVPLNTIEITRAILGNKIITFLAKIANHPFFEYKINMSASAKKRYTDQELVLQILKLIYYPDSGLSSKDMKPFIAQLKDEDIKAGLKSSIDNALYYLNEAFPKKQKFLKKIHIPMLVLLVLDIIKSNNVELITPIKFGRWAEEFFNNMPEDYKKACQSGSAKKENVQKRINIMKENFNNAFSTDIN